MSITSVVLVRVWSTSSTARYGAQVGQPLRHEAGVVTAAFSPDGALVVTASDDHAARVWIAPPFAPNIVATACKMLSDHDTAGLITHYGISVKDQICTGNEPAPDPSRMIDR